ncbi:hypothetical protein BTT_60560 (plasmid) [Bacillus thuringiensis serovar morrisoni str. 4AA1]|nr:hypothetical protein BTT_60560 [Bacillus thuringiensis serovar morrisoni str. 4AA1]
MKVRFVKGSDDDTISPLLNEWCGRRDGGVHASFED